MFSEKYNLEKYILSFLSIGNRTSPNDVPWKYERVCLLIVDFESSPPKIMADMKLFVNEGLIDEKFAALYSFEKLSIENFFDELYKAMIERYYLLGFDKE